MKSWTEKLAQAKVPLKKHIDKAFAGMPAGCLMYISTPQEINAFVRQLRPGQLILPKQLRAQLAKDHAADHTCPVTTGIFLRIVAEAALEELAQTQNLSAITPFWRAIDANSPLAKKLSCGPEFIADLQIEEATAAH
ncbi:hypothetical protein [Marinicella meishanensis]|uniref:hypothetical protein n=1 Tax=Marinicella meishanensis TaxID=2873263 RepID=UPI001CC1BA45|nr:hypothetical protein [Marinicella sp. NBU2979]